MSRDDDEPYVRRPLFVEPEEDDEDDEAPEDEDDEGDEGDDDDEDDDDEGEGDEDEDEKDEKPAEPEKFTVRKLLRQTLLGKDGRPYVKPQITTLPGGSFEDEAPNQTDIEAMFYPLYGGGDYLIVNQRTGKVHKKIHFDGPEKDPSADSPIPSSLPPSAKAEKVKEAKESTEAPAISSIDRLQLALASGQSKAVDELARLADRFTAEGNAEQLGKVVSALTEIATGKKVESSQDKFMEYIIQDRNKTSDMLTALLMESRKSKQPDASDVVRDTLGIVKDMLSLSKEISPGDDQTIALAKEVTGAVKEGLKDVTDTVVKVTGSGDLKALPPEQGPRQVFKCGRCGEEVKPHYRTCPSCGLIFKPGAIQKPAPPPPAPAPTAPAEVERFEPPSPPIPPEVKVRLGYLRKLAAFIQGNHDPDTKAQALVKVANDEERKQILFMAEFGYENLLKLSNPYRASPEIPDGEVIWRLVDSGNGKLWINRFFKAIRKASAEVGTQLSDEERTGFIETINAHSRVKFHIRKPKPATPPPAPVQKEEAPTAVSCPICDALVDIKDLESHLFTNHPRAGQQRKTPPPKAEPIQNLTGTDWDDGEDN